MQDISSISDVSQQDFRVLKIAAPLRHSVVESIRMAIAVGRFQPGERLTERNLCELTGVSRTLVREALRQLESEGLIVVVPNRGPMVARYTPEQAQKVYKVRSELEGLAAELFVQNADDAARRALHHAIEALARTADNDNRAERLTAKNHFYDCLIEGTGNEVLGQMLKLLNGRITLLRAASMRQKDRWRESIRELEELMRAIDAGDAAGARAAAVRHVANAAKAALAVLAESSPS